MPRSAHAYLRRDDLEAEQRAAEAEVERIENDIAEAERAEEELERRSPQAPEEVADWEAEARLVASELEGLREDFREAKAELGRILDRRQRAWAEEAGEPYDDPDDDDSDDGWPIDPEGPEGR